MQSKNGEKGFTYIEVIIAVVIMSIAILGCLSAVTYAMFREQQSENRNVARQITSAALESIFAARDLRNENALNNWEAINNTAPATPDGIFISGWTPIRREAGLDGIQGTADDACPTGTHCQVGTYTNTSAEIAGFERRVIFSDIVETNVLRIRKRKVEISVRYFANQLLQEETITTIIADLPFNN